MRDAKGLLDMAAQMEDWAKSLKRDAENCFVRLDGCNDLTVAASTLRRARGTEFFAIRLELNFHHGMEPGVEWTVYDGGTRKNFEAKTLTEAVNLALAASAPPPAEPVDAANRILNPLPF